MSNTTIARETLELAALAAGIELTHRRSSGAHYYDDPETGREEWRPHVDIADAARLAVRIDALVCVLPLRVEAVVLRDWRMSVKSVPHDGSPADKERAWCSSVTLAAADIGRIMRDGGAA